MAQSRAVNDFPPEIAQDQHSFGDLLIADNG
jgi:hypothetical protein